MPRGPISRIFASQCYICLFCQTTMPSPISECSLFAFVATTGSYFHLFIQARDLSTRPSRDERRRWQLWIRSQITMTSELGITAWLAPAAKMSKGWCYTTGVAKILAKLSDDEDGDSKLWVDADDKFGARGCLCWIDEEVIDGSGSWSSCSINIQRKEEGWDLSEKMWECVQYTSRPWSSGRDKKWESVLSTTRAGRLSARYGLEYKVGMVEIWSLGEDIQWEVLSPCRPSIRGLYTIIMEDQIKSTQMLVHSFYNHPGISFL